MAPVISVIIVTLNRADELLRCLESLEAIRTPTLEILVVDNGSRDRTVAIVRDACPAVRLLVAPENRGTSEARNAAARLARGEFLWFLDSDTTVTDPLWPVKLVDAFRNDPGLGGIGGEALLGEGGTITGTKYLRLQRNGLTESAVLDAPEGKVDVECLATSNLVLPRKVFEEVGGFDNLFFFYLEDLDLTWRIYSRGYRMEAWAKIPVKHFYSEQARREAHFIPRRNRVFFFVKNMPLQKILMLPLLDLIHVMGPARSLRFLDRARVHGRGAQATVAATTGARVTPRGLWEALAKSVLLVASLPLSYPLAIPHVHRILASRRRGGGTLGETDLNAYRRLERGRLPAPEWPSDRGRAGTV